MVNIGIITCQILELEFAHVLSTDMDVSDVTVVDNEFSAILFSELKRHGNKLVHRLAFPGEFITTAGDGHHVLIRVMEVGKCPRARPGSLFRSVGTGDSSHG